MFGQIVTGPPASGKSTYCKSLSHVFHHMNRPCLILNLDPASDPPSQEATPSSPTHSDASHHSAAPDIPYISITDLLSTPEAMQTYALGPNGATLYCLAFLLENMDWLFDLLRPYRNAYLIVDTPGQVEVFTCEGALKSIIDALAMGEEKFNKTKNKTDTTIADAECVSDFRFCVVNLVDAHYCSDGPKFVSVVMVCLKSMFMLGLPQVNVLSKIDLLESYGALQFDIGYYTEVQDLNYLLTDLDKGAFGYKYQKLNKAIVELIEDWGLVGFHPLCVHDNDNLELIVRVVDKANGYVFGGLDKNISIFGAADTGTV